jgi:hypothetical protein
MDRSGDRHAAAHAATAAKDIRGMIPICHLLSK